MKKFIFLILFILFISNVYALGLSPAKRNLDFKLGEEALKYTIINNEQRDISLSIYATGELAEFISFSEKNITMRGSEESKEFYAFLKIDNNFKPGENNGKIIVEEFIPDISGGETRVYAKFRVISLIAVNVPYPDKYVDVDIELKGDNVGEPIEIIVNVKNLGKENLDSVQAFFDIYENNEKLESLETNKDNLLKGDTKQLFTKLETKNMQPGFYSAVAKIVYDQNEIELGKDFNVGEEYIKIFGYTKYFVENQVNRFEIDSENEWNQKLKNVYGEIKINDFNVIKTLSADFEPRERKILSTFWDTTRIGLGKYPVNISLFYSNKSTTELGDIDVITLKEFEKLNSRFSWIYILIGLLSVFVVILLVYIKKRNKENVYK